MTADLQTILDAALQLSEQDRGALVSRLLDTMSPEEDALEDEDAFFDELDRRFAEGLEATVDWKTVRDEPF